MEVMEHAPKTRAERLATLRTEAALLIAKIAEARRLSAGDPLAALRLAAKVGAAMLWAVHQVEIGPTEEEGLISLHGTLSRAGHLPRSLEQPVNVLWLYHRETKGELSRSRLYSSRPWPVCFAALARLGAWFFVDYLSLPLPPELEPLPGEGARPARCGWSAEKGLGARGAGRPSPSAPGPCPPRQPPCSARSAPARSRSKPRNDSGCRLSSRTRGPESFSS